MGLLLSGALLEHYSWRSFIGTAAMAAVSLLVTVVLVPDTKSLALSATAATNTIVDSLPPDKQGVASAMNDVTRELGAALGIALLASLFSDGYRGQLKLPTAVPQQAVGTIRDHRANPCPDACVPAATTRTTPQGSKVRRLPTPPNPSWWPPRLRGQLRGTPVSVKEQQ